MGKNIQKKDLISIAKTVFENEYNEIYKFFSNIIDTCVSFEKQNVEYAVILAPRRCNTLFWIFWEIMHMDESMHKYDQEMLLHIAKENVMSNVDAAGRKGLADSVSRIMVVTDLIIHGREINNLLLKMQNNSSADFENKTEIHAFAVNDCTMLIYSKYQHCLKMVKKCSGKEWRFFLKKVATLISVSGIPNTCDSPVMKFVGKSDFCIPPDKVGNFSM